MEHLKACAEIATQRTINWQKFCMKDDCRFFQISVVTGNKPFQTRPVALSYCLFSHLSSVSLFYTAVLYFLLQVSFLVDEGVSPVLLQLLSCALCGSKVLASSSSSSFSGGGSGSTGQTGASQSSQSKSSSKKSKKEDKEKDKDGQSSIPKIDFILILLVKWQIWNTVGGLSRCSCSDRVVFWLPDHRWWSWQSGGPAVYGSG